MQQANALSLLLRVYSLTRRTAFGLVIGVISIVIFGIAVALTALLSAGQELTRRYNDTIHDLGSVAISLHLVNDFAISGALIWYLHRNRTGIPRSDALIDDIVRRAYSPRLRPFGCAFPEIRPS